MPIKLVCSALLVGSLLQGCVGDVSPNVPHTSVSPRNATGDTGAPLSGVGFYAGCMATLVAPRKAVTAAHCVQNAVQPGTLLLLGSDINQPKYRLPVLQATRHPQYNPTTRAYDVAVLSLGVDAAVPPLAVVDNLPADAMTTPLLLPGYGASGSGTRSASGAAQVLSVSLSAQDALSVTWENLDQPCFGDNAAPLVYPDMGGSLLLAGLASSTTTADCSGQTVATRLDVLADALGLPVATPAQSSPSTPTAPSDSSDCGTVTERGQCSGTVVTFCDATDQALHTQDCSINGAHCVWSYADQQFACGAPPDSVAQTGCAGASFAGRCDNNVAVWCRDGKTLVRDDCTVAKKLCGYNLVLGYFSCLAPGTAPG